MYEYLADHPAVCMSSVKEIHFFSHYFDRGLEWYEGHFSECGEGDIVGEASPSYFVHPDAMRRLADTVPGVRILTVLRNPIERAYSDYWMRVRRGAQPFGETFSEAIRSGDGVGAYLYPGRYDEHIERMLKHLPTDQLKFIVTEELSERPTEVLNDVLEFLGVRADWERPSRGRHNIRSVPRGWGAAMVSRALYMVWAKTGYNLPLSLKRRLKGPLKKMRRAVESVFYTHGRGDDMPDSDRTYLRRYYDSHVFRTGELIGRDLTEVWPEWAS